jgi:hypothetical protein
VQAEYDSSGSVVNPDGVPDAPFKKSWKEMVFKALLRDAVEKGHDYFAWTPGDIQAKRYSSALQKAVDTVETKKNPDGTYDASFYKNTRVVADEKGVNPTRLSDVVGKAAANKLISEADAAGGEFAVVQGTDLKVGGEGMRAVYDRVLVNFANDYLKKWGVKVGDVTIQMRDAYDRSLREGLPVHGFKIPAEMAKDIRENGLAAYMPASPKANPLQGATVAARKLRTVGATTQEKDLPLSSAQVRRIKE